MPFSVIAGPPIDKVVPSTTAAVLPIGVKVSPSAVRALLAAAEVARAMVDVPIMREPAVLRE